MRREHSLPTALIDVFGGSISAPADDGASVLAWHFEIPFAATGRPQN